MAKNNPTKPYIPPYDRAPSQKTFKRVMWAAFGFLFLYGCFLIYKNYYAPGATPPTQRKQLAVPQQYQDTATTAPQNQY